MRRRHPAPSTIARLAVRAWLGLALAGSAASIAQEPAPAGPSPPSVAPGPGAP